MALVPPRKTKEFALRDKTLADLIWWAIDNQASMDKVVFFTREEPYEPAGAFRSIEYAHELYARIER